MLENVRVCDLLELKGMNAEEYFNNDHILTFLHEPSIQFNKTAD